MEVWFGVDDPPDDLLYSGDLTNRFAVTHALRTTAAHYWRVVSRNDTGAINGPVWRFTTMAAIQAPHLALPVFHGTHLDLQWTPVQSGVHYHVLCSTNLALGFNELAVVQTNCFTHTNGLQMPMRYYRVIADVDP